MDYFQSHSGKRNQQRGNKKRLSQEQVRLLETSFDLNQKLDPDRKSQLAQELGLPPRQIAIWYQNKRARWKSQSLEVDYKALHLRLENALEDNQRLETEVQRLRQELDKLAHRDHDHDHQDTFVVPFNFKDSSSSTLPANDHSLISTSCDEVGSSGSCLLLDHHHSKLRLLDKDLYACFNVGAAEGHDFFAPSIS